MRGDTRVCNTSCRGFFNGRVSLVDCERCPCGFNKPYSHLTGYCNVCGCKCGTVFYEPEEIEICRACDCECGTCKIDSLTYCCACGCRCGTCFIDPSLADLLTPQGFHGAVCCHCKCFPSIARVSLENGKSKTMTELQIGDKVQTGRHMHY